MQNQIPYKDENITCILGDNSWHFELYQVTSQAKVYKQSLHRFFSKTMPLVPKAGEFEVEIAIKVNPNYPTIDLDNVAKAVLDGLKGHVFIDDGQIMRLLVEKEFCQSEMISIKIRQR